MNALLLSLVLPAAAQSGEPGGSVCDRTLPRESAPAPDFTRGWELADQGEMGFYYRFYRRAGESRVTAMSARGHREAGLVTVKTSWQVGDEILSRRDGPEGEGEPVCARAIRRPPQDPTLGGFDLHRLYLSLKDRLRR